MNYIYSRSTNWEEVVGIIIRGALTEDKATYIKPPKYLYQKILVFIWSLMMLVLISTYQDNLIALITKPSINIPFTSTDGMIEQNKMKWGLIDGGLLSGYAKSKAQLTQPGHSLPVALRKAQCMLHDDDEFCANLSCDRPAGEAFTHRNKYPTKSKRTFYCQDD